MKLDDYVRELLRQLATRARLGMMPRPEGDGWPPPLVTDLVEEFAPLFAKVIKVDRPLSVEQRTLLIDLGVWGLDFFEDEDGKWGLDASELLLTFLEATPEERSDAADA